MTFAAVRCVVAVRTFAEMAARPKRHTNPNGPRFETPASVKAFHHAHLLGGRSKRPRCEAARSDDRGVRGCTPQGRSDEPTTQMGRFHRPHQKMIGSR